MKSVINQVLGQVENQAWGEVANQFEIHARGKIWDRVRYQVYVQVMIRTHDYIEDQIWEDLQ